MSVSDLLVAPCIPPEVKCLFWRASPPTCAEENLFREVAARAVLDSLGVTGLSTERVKGTDRLDDGTHRRCVFEARQWLRDDATTGDVQYLFDLAGVECYGVVAALLKRRPLKLRTTVFAAPAEPKVKKKVRTVRTKAKAPKRGLVAKRGKKSKRSKRGHGRG